MLTVKWIKCGDGRQWCPLVDLNLDNLTTSGVYVIWHEGSPSRVVRIGQGVIADRLSAHRTDAAILVHAKKGKLRVTWASVPVAQRDGVERYLANHYQPLVGDAYPNVEPIPVNLVA